MRTNTIQFKLTKLLISAIAIISLSASNNAFSAESLPNRVLLKFKKDSGLVSMSTQLSKIQALNTASGASREVGHLQALRFNRHGLGVLRFSSRLNASEAAKLLRDDPRVEWAQPDYIYRVFPVSSNPQSETLIDVFSSNVLNPLNVLGEFVDLAIKSDPAFPVIPALPNPAQADPDLVQTWGLTKIEADSIWNEQSGSRKIIVADIDTGIDYTHPDLLNNLWINPNPTMGDVVGYDFANKKAMPFDDHGHGTHTTGTIGATGGNGIGIAGVSPAVSIMGLKFITAGGSGSTSDAVDSIDYAIDHGARIMSNSWGGPSDEGEDDKMLVDAVGRAEAADILFVAAAGNDGSDNDTRPMYPAAIQKANVLAVASSNERDVRSFFSNYGLKTVHVAAPGSNVYSTLPGNKYAKFSGTSMACPHVAGLAALILAERPELSAVQVKEIIMNTVDPLAAFDGKIVTGGRVNARAALFKARNFRL